MGALGLLMFAFLAWQLLAALSSWMALSIPMLGWLMVSVLAWKLWHLC